MSATNSAIQRKCGFLQQKIVHIEELHFEDATYKSSHSDLAYPTN